MFPLRNLDKLMRFYHDFRPLQRRNTASKCIKPRHSGSTIALETPFLAIIVSFYAVLSFVIHNFFRCSLMPKCLITSMKLNAEGYMCVNTNQMFGSALPSRGLFSI